MQGPVRNKFPAAEMCRAYGEKEERMDGEERRLLQLLDTLVRRESARAVIDPIVARVEGKLAADPGAVMAWEPVPLAAYGADLPAAIRSSWVFILRAGLATGAERHPNSHQRMMSYRGAGDLPTGLDPEWHSHPLVSDPAAPLERRWVSIPPNTWHQAVVPAENWVVVSFHTVPEDELIEERPDPADGGSTRQRRYLEEGN
jgi:hypothetical protein